jgi:hypothetical protein
VPPPSDRSDSCGSLKLDQPLRQNVIREKRTASTNSLPVAHKDEVEDGFSNILCLKNTTNYPLADHAVRNSPIY